MKLTMVLAVAAAMTTASGDAAKPAQKRAEAFDALIACRAIADQAEKFACLDRTSAVLEAAANAGDLVVVDRQQIRETKKTLFGFDLPNLGRVFGDDKGAEVQSVEGKIAAAHTDGDGRWVITLADGALWRQIDGNVLGRRPKPGMDVKINRAALGSYKMAVAGQPGIRVRRSN